MNTITYEINTGDESSGNPAITLANPEQLGQAVAQITSVISAHNELKNLKADLMSDLHLAWSGNAKEAFDDYTMFMQRFLDDLTNPLNSYKEVLKGVETLVQQLNGDTPNVKRAASEVQVP